MPSIINTNTDGNITLTGLVMEPSGVPTTGAVVSGTLYDTSENVVWSGVSFTDVGGGSYTCAFSATSVPLPGTYRFVVTALKSGLTLTVEHDVVVVPLQV